MPTEGIPFATIPASSPFTLLDDESLLYHIREIERGIGSVIESEHLLEKVGNELDLQYLFSRSDFSPERFHNLINPSIESTRMIATTIDAISDLTISEASNRLRAIEEHQYQRSIRRVSEHIYTQNHKNFGKKLNVDYYETLSKLVPTYTQLVRAQQDDTYHEIIDSTVVEFVEKHWKGVIVYFDELLHITLTTYCSSIRETGIFFDGGPHPGAMLGTALFAIALLGLAMGGILPPVVVFTFLLACLKDLLRDMIELLYPDEFDDWIAKIQNYSRNITTGPITGYAADARDVICLLPEGSSSIRFLREYNAWGTRNLGRQPDHIAIYRGSPEQSLQYIGRLVETVTGSTASFYHDIKDKSYFESDSDVHILRDLYQIEPRFPSRGLHIRGPRYVRFGTLAASSSLRDALS